MIGRRPLREEKARIVGIENDAVFRADFGNVQVLRAEKSDLFADGEDSFDVRVRNVLLLQATDGFDDNGAA